MSAERTSDEASGAEPASAGRDTGSPSPGRGFNDWIGRERVTEDTLTLERARKLAATLDLDPDGVREADPLPHGWHWIYHRAAAARSALGEDGHERRGDFLPPIPRERRMWAGGRLRFVRPLRIGAAVRRVSTIRSVEEKEGRSGPLAFVTVEHRLHDADGVALEEEQDLVYLDRRPKQRGSAATRPGAEAGARADDADTPSGSTRGSTPRGELDWAEPFVADEVTLFRFSALTFNGHRIHYDLRYATEVEGYRGLVVHGPLLALLLLGAGVKRSVGPARAGRAASRAEAPTVDFRYRALRPVFCKEAIELCGRAVSESSGRTLALWVAHPRRGVAMEAELVIEG